MTPQFNLLDEPWLPVRLPGGNVQSMGLLEVMRRSAEIIAPAETSPPTFVAEYRLLLSIVHRALERSRGSWRDRDRLGWYRNGLPIEELCSYLEAWRERFWVFHPEHPFMQVSALATAEETCDKRKPWTQISLASATGNAPVMFDHAVDGWPVAINWQAALGHLLGYLQFTPGGLVKTLRDADKAGALNNTAAVLPMGDTLSQTLCLALHSAPLPNQREPDLPAWERAPLSLGELRGDPVLATGPNDRYTRQSRAVLLQPEEDGQVRWLRFAAGLALGEDPQQPDPMACYREGSNGLVRVSFTEGRAVWRDLPSLVPAPDGGAPGGFRAAAVVNAAIGLHRLIGRQRAYQPLLVAGLATDQAKLLRWRIEQFPLPQALLAEPESAHDLHVYLALCETLYKPLRALSTELVAGTLPDSTSKDTRARARELVDRGPFVATYFAVTERQLWELMKFIAADDADAASLLWQRTLRDAARQAWDRQVATLGHSARVLQSEARCAPRMNRLLRQHLPVAYASKPITTEGA